jgi:dTDP-4-dehydrorhamnose 3,5-epimerase-like enzyme
MKWLCENEKSYKFTLRVFTRKRRFFIEMVSKSKELKMTMDSRIWVDRSLLSKTRQTNPLHPRKIASN